MTALVVVVLLGAVVWLVTSAGRQPSSAVRSRSLHHMATIDEFSRAMVALDPARTPPSTPQVTPAARQGHGGGRPQPPAPVRRRPPAAGRPPRRRPARRPSGPGRRLG